MLELKKNFKCGAGADDEASINLEENLGVFFPNSYKKFLKKYGYASWFGDYINGISENSLYDLKNITWKLRNEQLPDSFSPFPHNAVAIKKYDAGGYYMLYSIDSCENGKVVLLEDEAFNNPVETWESFEAFLEDQCC